MTIGHVWGLRDPGERPSSANGQGVVLLMANRVMPGSTLLIDSSVEIPPQTSMETPALTRRPIATHCHPRGSVFTARACLVTLTLGVVSCGNNPMGKGNPDGGRADSGVTDGSLDDDVKEPPHMRLVEIQFAARAGTVVADCAGTYTLGTPPAQVRIEDFRLYVSNFRLVDGAGTEHPITLMTDEKWQDINTALLDFEDGTGTCSENTTPDTNSVVRGWTTAASQTALRFTLGVPHEQNHRLPTSATPPLTVGAMFWSWQAGYKFLRLDLKQIDPPETSWLIHVGSHNCQSASPAEPPTTLCGRPNRAEISLSPFDPNSNVVVVDVAALVSASDLTTNTPETGPGCMSESDDPDCAAIFTNLGIDFATGSCADECTGQTFFRVE